MFTEFIKYARELVEKAQRLHSVLRVKDQYNNSRYEEYDGAHLGVVAEKFASSLKLVSLNLDQALDIRDKSTEYKKTVYAFSMPAVNTPLILWLDNGLVVEGTFNYDPYNNDKPYFTFNTGWLPKSSQDTRYMKKQKKCDRVAVLKWAYAITPLELDPKWEEKLYGRSYD